MEPPFRFGQIVAPEYFVGRQEELAALPPPKPQTRLIGQWLGTRSRNCLAVRE
jgi:hypothetical protein